jgi:hypothetical protein
MLDLALAQDFERLRRAVLDLTASVATQGQILVEKGICTVEEYETTKLRVEAYLDQQLAESRDKKLSELEAMNPVAKALYEATGLDLSKMGE